MITVGEKWKGRGGDITAAFLQGEDLPREKALYIWLPRNMPEELLLYLKEVLAGYRSGILFK